MLSPLLSVWNELPTTFKSFESLSSNLRTYIFKIVFTSVDVKTEREVRQRVQAEVNAWRAVEGVMAYRRISKD